MGIREIIGLVALHQLATAAKNLCAVGAATDDKVLRGIAIAGRPVARLFDNGQTLEVTRVTTDGYRDACSMLYGACWRAARALGYRRLVTYTQAGEGGGLAPRRRMARRSGAPCPAGLEHAVTAPRTARHGTHVHLQQPGGIPGHHRCSRRPVGGGGYGAVPCRGSGSGIP